ncbi:MAG: ATP-binding protein [Elusimicrobiota bacterium]|nr:ATP-binding protein [Elusimicrobiota bacterium]
MRSERRAVYFAFQGLLMAVLMLLFLYEAREHARWTVQLTALLVLLAGSLGAIRLVPEAALARGVFPAALFLVDAGAATFILRWTEARSELFLIYALIVFGSALTRSARQALAIAGGTILLYLVSGWRSGGLPADSDFWLRAVFLATSAALLAILAGDVAAAQAEEKRRYDERLISVQRLATLGRLSAEVAHRIKGPLTTIAVDAEVLSHRHAQDPATLKELAQIREEVERCKVILKDLLDLGRIEEMDSEPLDLREPVDAAARSVEPQYARRGVSLARAGLDRPLRMKGDAPLLQEAVSALLLNALEASADGAVVRVEAWTAQGRHHLRVTDSGEGVASGDLERIFEPFFTTKAGSGSGLGLSAALRIAEKHHGTVEAHSDGRGRGARFTLVLPAGPT